MKTFAPPLGAPDVADVVPIDVTAGNVGPFIQMSIVNGR
jgi:hypothetical protein